MSMSRLLGQGSQRRRPRCRRGSRPGPGRAASPRSARRPPDRLRPEAHAPAVPRPARPVAAADTSGSRRAGSPWRARQQQGHGRAAPRAAFDLHLAARLGGEAVDLGQAEPRALAGFLGGEERIEGARQHLGRHADARVGDAEAHEVAQPVRPRRACGALSARIAIVPPPGIASRALTQRFSTASSSSPASTSTGHRSAPKRISTCRSPRSERVSISRMPWRCAPQVERGGTHRLAARERQQVAGEVGAALDRPAHAVERAAGSTPHRRAASIRLTPLRIDLQQVVEVVRHAAGELAERFQLLRMPQRLLGLAQPRLLASAAR